MIGNISKFPKITATLRAFCLLLACGLLAAFPAIAQDTQPDFPMALDKKLAARATNVNEVTMNKTMLAFASQFLEKGDGRAKHLIQKLNGIYVRDYEFDKPGQYTTEDLQAIRKQFSGPEWNPMVRSRSKKGGDDTDIYMKMVNGEVEGLFVLNAEPNELNLVYISGPIRPEDLKDLSGNFGVPNVGGTGGSNKASREVSR